ncbi:MAG: glycoside hydrolase family 127 protein [Victivallales bacterium]|jgi:uncharacterized protein|nr:glycoside hydrolase family 127 protein [Victivallales bacterium]MBT7302686.1 glycoside hydrolase family 127 protein [Victivallales bacterium]
MQDRGVIGNQNDRHSQLQSIGIGDACCTDGFWGERQRRAHEVTLPCLWDLLADPDQGHVLQNLRIAAGLEEGEFAGVHWDDAWMAKWLEAAAMTLASTGDESLDRQLDELIDLLAKVQAPDGYLASQTQANGEERLTDPHYHELYTMGHLLTAAVVHHRTTGKTTFLAIARGIADFVTEEFSGEVSRDKVRFPFNPSIIMGLAELSRETGEARYLEAAQGFVDRRGSAPKRWREALLHDWIGTDMCQDRVPLRDENEMVGHSVLNTYLYAGAADVVAATGEEALFDALKRIWANHTERKMFINGGACALSAGISKRGVYGKGQWVDSVHEAAGDEYSLPNALSYNETCAQIGVFMWAWRMLALEPDPNYADVMEQTLYSGILSGVGLDGTSWFYRNFLRWHGGENGPYTHGHKRYTCVRFQPGRQAICCPTNLLRTEVEFHNYLYTVSVETLWLHHYAASTLATTLPDGTSIALTQETNYPWDGDIRLTFSEVGDAPFALKFRIPAWANGATLRVNGSPAAAEVVPGTYAEVQRQWRPGDVVELTLPMQPRLMMAHPLVEECRNQVAVLRGPMLYCLESHDLPEGVPTHEILLPRDIELTARHDPALLGGVTVLEGMARRLPQGDWDGSLYRMAPTAPAEPVPIRLVPYYAWANRGIGEMTVWIPVC